MKQTSHSIRWLWQQQPRSEWWRLEWSLRSCVSVTAICFLALLPHAAEQLHQLEVLSFGGFVTVLVKDINFGATILNGWGCILGAVLASALCALSYLIILSSVTEISSIANVAATLMTLLLNGFILQYAELPPMGKKLGVSLVAINIISLRRELENPYASILNLLYAVLIGVACAMVGNIIPLPVALAGTELKQRLHYYSFAISELLIGVVSSWQRLQSIPAANASSAISASSVEEDTSQLRHDDVIASHSIKAKGWRILWIVFKAVRRFKAGGAHQRSLHFSHRSYDGSADGDDYLPITGRNRFESRFIRLELLSFLTDNLDRLSQRNFEARFGPSRFLAVRGQLYVQLITQLLSVLSLLERRLSAMEAVIGHRVVYQAFFKHANFRYAMHNYTSRLAEAVRLLSIVIAEDSLQKMEQHYPGSASFAAVSALADLLRARVVFDDAYMHARIAVYYPTRLNAAIVDDGEAKHYASSDSRQNEGKDCYPVYADVLFQMNSFIFMMDVMCRLLIDFWSDEDLARVENLASAKQKVTEGAVDSRYSEFTKSKYLLLLEQFYQLVLDLIPKQSGNLCCSYNASSDLNSSFHCHMSDAVINRVQLSMKVSLAMVLAGLYGIGAGRPQEPLAAFTIAYLAGGSVSGINVLTCLNRAAGTVVACIYSILVIFIVNIFENTIVRNLFVAFAVILFQLPATYVRTYPLHSYAGNVAGFTVALLLLDPNLSVDLSVNRIVDTYVGVGIYLIVEFSLSATYTEKELISKMETVFVGINQRFADFHEHFHVFNSATAAVVATSGATCEDKCLTSNLLSTLSTSTKLEVNSLHRLIREQKSLIPFYKAEPTVFRPPQLPDSLLHEVITRQHDAVLSLQVLLWVVRSCDGSYRAGVEDSIFRIDNILQGVRKEELFSESLDDGLSCGAASKIEDGAMNSRMRMGYKSDIELPPRASRHRSVSAADFEILLYPLETNFEQVERFGSLVLSFLSAAVRQLRDWTNRTDVEHRHTLTMREDDSAGNRFFRKLFCKHSLFGVTGSSINAKKRTYSSYRSPYNLRHIASAASMRMREEFMEMGKNFRFLTEERLIAVAHGEIAEVDEFIDLHDQYQSILGNLQTAIMSENINSVAGSVSMGRNMRITSNREIIVVNALLASAQDLVDVLKSLVVTVRRMQAHRDISYSQDGKSI